MITISRQLGVGLGILFVCNNGGGEAVDRNDLELLASLERLYSIFNKYDLSCDYNMGEISLFFQLVLRYIVILPNEDPTTI